MANLKILHVVEACRDGVARHLIALARASLASGAEVHILYAPSGMDGYFPTALEALPGVVAEPLAMTRSIQPGDVRSVAGARRYIARAGPFDVVHGHSSKGGAVARLAGVGGRARVVYTPNAPITMSPAIGPGKRRVYGLIERGLGALTDTIICVSPEEKRHVEGLGIPGRKLIVIPNGIEQVDLKPREAARAALGLPDDGLVIGYVGRFAEQKAPEVLVEAFARLRRSGLDATLAMIGSGPLQGRIVGLAQELGVGDSVVIRASDEARTLMLAFDVLALSSRFEGLPYVAIEGLAAGLPIVATRASNVELLVLEGENGFVVPTGDPAAFGESLEKLVRDPGLRARFGARSAELKAGFTAEAMTRATLAAYAGARPLNC